MADARHNTLFSALNIPFESEQKQKFQMTQLINNHLLFSTDTKIQLNSG